MVSQFILWADLIARRLLRSNSILRDDHIGTKPLTHLMLEPAEGRSAFGIKQVAGPAAPVIRRAKAVDRRTKPGRLFQQFRQVLLQFPTPKGIPDLDWLSIAKQVIYVPMRFGH